MSCSTWARSNFDDRGNDSVRITGAGGAKRPDTLKVVAGYHDGWMGTGMIGFSWPEAYLKCETSANIIKGLVEERGWKPDEINVEYIGYNSLLGANADPAQRDNLNECFIRMTIRTKDKRIADGFGRLFPWLGLSGPPFVGRLQGRAGREGIARAVADTGAARGDRAACCDRRRGGRMKVGLWKIAHARSGDKADRADIGLFAYDAPTYAVLKREVTRERLAAHFADICKGPVELYPLDNLLAIKIVLNAALQGGAARSLRMDNLGKSVAAQLLRMEIEAPADLPRLARCMSVRADARSRSRAATTRATGARSCCASPRSCSARRASTAPRSAISRARRACTRAARSITSRPSRTFWSP